MSYNKDVTEIEQIFVSLDRQLKYLHKNGYCVNELNSDSILLEKNKFSSHDNYSVFMFASIGKIGDKERDVYDNILSLSKLAIGSFISPETGFCDYSQLSTDYIRKYFEEISLFIPNQNYFSNVIMKGDCTYYSDYIKKLSQENGKNNAIQKRKANEYGKMYVPEDNAAFIQIVFYPVILISIITIIAVLSKILI